MFAEKNCYLFCITVTCVACSQALMLCPFVFPFVHFSIRCCNQRRNEFLLPGKCAFSNQFFDRNRTHVCPYLHFCLFLSQITHVFCPLFWRVFADFHQRFAILHPLAVLYCLIWAEPKTIATSNILYLWKLILKYYFTVKLLNFYYINEKPLIRAFQRYLG